MNGILRFSDSLHSFRITMIYPSPSHLTRSFANETITTVFSCLMDIIKYPATMASDAHDREVFVMRKKEVVAMLLAGGQGKRLKGLTRTLAKPAVFLGELTALLISLSAIALILV